MRLSTFLAALLAAAALPAQTGQNSRIIGWVSSPLLPASGGLQSQDVGGKCLPAKRLCSNILLNNPLLYAGGTAYDPRHESVWVSDGRALVEVDPVTCKTICAPKPSIMRAGAVISGLAVANKRGMLYHLETKPGYLGILPWNNRACPPVPTKGGCFLQLKSTSYAAGLAYDEVRDLLYYTVTTPSSTGPVNVLHIATPTSGCRPLCTVKLPVCATSSTRFGAVTGLAFDPCTDILYATDGQTTMRLSVGDARKCVIRLLGCCAKQVGGGLFQGLGLIPGYTSTDVGKSCITKGCTYCPNLKIRFFGGAPALGNQEFGIEMVNGSVGSAGLLVVALGDCTAGVPFLCGQLHLPASPVVVMVPMGTLSGGSCAATARLRAPIPVDPNLCGIRLCLQSLALCSSQGYAMSHALQLRL